MPSILKRDTWADATLPWSEDDLQIAVTEAVRKHPLYGIAFRYWHDMNAAKRSSAAKAKAMGMEPGTPDCCFVMQGGQFRGIEVKVAGKAPRPNNGLSISQRDTHELLNRLGADTVTVIADCPTSAVAQCMAILDRWLTECSA